MASVNPLSEFVVVVDSRERNPLFFVNTRVAGLKTGDYSILGFEDRIAVERKSVGDLFGTLAGGMVRFKRELERAKSLDYFCILVEGGLDSVLLKEGAEFSLKDGCSVVRTLMTLHLKYGIPVWFCRSREEAQDLLWFLFESFLKNEKFINKGVLVGSGGVNNNS